MPKKARSRKAGAAKLNHVHAGPTLCKCSSKPDGKRSVCDGGKVIPYTTFRNHRKRVVEYRQEWGGLPFERSELRNWVIENGLAVNKGDLALPVVPVERERNEQGDDLGMEVSVRHSMFSVFLYDT